MSSVSVMFSGRLSTTPAKSLCWKGGGVSCFPGCSQYYIIRLHLIWIQSETRFSSRCYINEFLTMYALISGSF